MSNYYFMAQLPSLDSVSDTSPPGITEERFAELCSRLLNKKMVNALAQLTLMPARGKSSTGYGLIDAWNEGERQLRLALGRLRADKMKKPFESESASFPVNILQAAQTAVGIEDPLEAEKYLNNFRLRFLETLRPMDAFCDDAILYYGLKLKLLSRMRQFDEAKGQQIYKNIYASILEGDRQEVTQ